MWQSGHRERNKPRLTHQYGSEGKSLPRKEGKKGSAAKPAPLRTTNLRTNSRQNREDLTCKAHGKSQLAEANKHERTISRRNMESGVGGIRDEARRAETKRRKRTEKNGMDSAFFYYRPLKIKAPSKKKRKASRKNRKARRKNGKARPIRKEERGTNSPISPLFDQACWQSAEVLGTTQAAAAHARNRGLRIPLRQRPKQTGPAFCEEKAGPAGQWNSM